MNPAAPPSPLEWHPAYRDKTWLLDWLNGEGTFADLHAIRLPVPQRSVMATMSAEDEDPTSLSTFSTMTMTKRRCAGPAPYVGQPFIYTWWAGVDELGRCIAAESSRQYDNGGASFILGPCVDPATLPEYGTEPEPTSDDLARESLTTEELMVLQQIVQALGPIPDGRLAETIDAIRRYLRDV